MKKTFNSATVGCSNIKKDVVESPNFIAGKYGDVEATDKVIEQIWHPKKTKVLEKQLTSKTVFLSQPSTTKSNVIPIQLALRLSSRLERPFVNGDEFFDTLHNVASKNISRDRRVFNKREFNLVDKEKMNSLLQGKDIIIVDDIITTGSSIRNFKEFLTEQNLNVIHAVGLMGDSRLELDSSTKNKLSDLLKTKNINVDMYPELAGAVAAITAMEKKAEIDGLKHEQRAIVSARVRQNIIESIERGNIPQMKIRVEQVKEILNESTPELEM